MRLVVNGKITDLPDTGINIADILSIKGVKNPEMVSVQLNEKFVDQDQFSTTNVKENDELDFIYFMGGGNIQNTETLKLIRNS